MQNQPNGEQGPGERASTDAQGARSPGPQPTDPRQSEWFALPTPSAGQPPQLGGAAPSTNYPTWGAQPTEATRAYPAYPPPPEYYGAPPASLPVARVAAPQPWPTAPGALVSNPHSAASGYPTYAPDGVVDSARMTGVANPHEQTRSGKPEAAGCASGAAIIGILTKLAIGIKFLLPLLSVLVSFGVYAALFGWQFGLGIIVTLFIHEMGHFVVIRAKGLPASLPIFIPLLGAYVAMQRMPHNVRDEAEIGIAGPIAGALAGLICLGLYYQTSLPVMLPLAYFSFLINLLNLIPVAPLDGARVTAAISHWFWPVGLALLAVGIYYTHNLFLILIGVIGLFLMIERFRESPAQRAYYAVSALTRVYVTVIYFGLIAALALALYFTQHLLPLTGVVY